jgi:hypothetical protein
MRISEIDLRLRNDEELAHKALRPEGCRENGAATLFFVRSRSTRDMRLPHASLAPHFGDNSGGHSFSTGSQARAASISIDL